MGGGEVGPQLEAVHASDVVALGHFLMQDAASGRHPLHVTGTEGSPVAEAVAVIDGARQHVGDRLDSAVRMPRETGEVILRPVVAEIVEEQERVEFGRLAEAEGTVELDARAFDVRLGLGDAANGAEGHDRRSSDCFSDLLVREASVKFKACMAVPRSVRGGSMPEEWSSPLATTSRGRHAVRHPIGDAVMSCFRPQFPRHRTMTSLLARLGERRVRILFRWSLWLKALLSLMEILGGLVLEFVSNTTILGLAQALTRNELLQDPNDWIANFLLNQAHRFSVDKQSFAAFFLLSHGAVKLVLVAGVLAGIGWAYPAFMIALVLLIGYQGYRLIFLGFSLWLSWLTILDIVILILTWHEYRLHRAAVAASSET